MTITYKVFTCDGYGTVQWGDNFKSFEEAEEYIKKSKWVGNPPFIIAERIPERVFPKTSLTEDEVLTIYGNADTSFLQEILIVVANAAIKQYILDNEKIEQWDMTKEYKKGDEVVHGNVHYVAKCISIGDPPCKDRRSCWEVKGE